MKNFFINLLLIIVLCTICFVAGVSHRPEAEIFIEIDTVYLEQEVPADSGEIYAVLKLKDGDFINTGILMGELVKKDSTIDSLYSQIQSVLNKKEIIAHTKIEVNEGNMDVDYLLSKRLFLWNWQPVKKLQEIQIITIEVPVMREKKWYERWYVTMPIGILIGYGMEKVL